MLQPGARGRTKPPRPPKSWRLAATRPSALASGGKGAAPTGKKGKRHAKRDVGRAGRRGHSDARESTRTEVLFRASQPIWPAAAGIIDRVPMPEATDRELLARVLDGDSSAGDELCARLYPSVQAVAASVLNRRDPSQILEVTQHAFLRLYERDMRALRDFRGEDLGPYVRTIARHLAFDALRGRPTVPLDPETGDEAGRAPIETEEDEAPGPSEILRVTELREIVRATIAGGDLTEREQTAVSRVYLDEADRRTVAAEMGVTTVNLDVILHRARRKLRPDAGGSARSAGVR